LWAVKCSVYVAAVPGAGVPLSAPVVGLKVTPAGSVSVGLSPRAGGGEPPAATWKDPAWPTVEGAPGALGGRRGRVEGSGGGWGGVGGGGGGAAARWGAVRCGV